MQASCIHRHAPFSQRMYARREKREIVVSPRPTHKSQYHRRNISLRVLPSRRRAPEVSRRKLRGVPRQPLQLCQGVEPEIVTHVVKPHARCRFPRQTSKSVLETRLSHQQIKHRCTDNDQEGQQHPPQSSLLVSVDESGELILPATGRCQPRRMAICRRLKHTSAPTTIAGPCGRSKTAASATTLPPASAATA